MLGYAFLPFSQRGLVDQRNVLLQDENHAITLDNIVIGVDGNGESRPVINQVLVSAFPARVTSIHEHINAAGSSRHYAGTQGRLYNMTVASGAISVPTTATSFGSAAVGWDTARRIRSSQMGNRMIVYNGTNRPVWTEDGMTFDAQRALSGFGSATSNSSATSLRDAGITSWLLEPVAIGDIVFNRTENGYGVITAIVTGALTHTNISSAATGIGTITNISSAGHSYEIIDTVALNVLPADGPLSDNVGLAGATTGVGQVTVSGMTNWFATEIRIGDFIRNTTREAITQVTAIASATLGINGIAAQVCGDSLIFFKDAFPVPHYSHTFFDRLYTIDARGRGKIRVSTKGDPSDYTAAGGTLKATTIEVGSFASEPENFQQIASFRNNIVFGGEKNTLMFQGGDPIVDVSGAETEFELVSIIPVGIRSQDSMVAAHEVLLLIGHDGIQAIGFGQINQVETQNIASPLSLRMQAQVEEALDVSAGRVRLFHYPRRRMVILRAATDSNFVYSHVVQAPFRRKAAESQYILAGLGTWTSFTGQFAGADAEFVDSDGRMLVAFTSGGVNFIGEFDAMRQTTAATPDRALNNMVWSTTLNNLNAKAKEGYRPDILHGKFAALHCEVVSGNAPTVTVEAITGLASAASPAGTVSFGVGATGTEEDTMIALHRATMVSPPESGRKYPLRWRGQEARFSATVSGLGPLSLKGLGLWYSTKGRK